MLVYNISYRHRLRGRDAIYNFWNLEFAHNRLSAFLSKMSHLIESSKDGSSKDVDASDHDSSRVESEGRPGPAAGWFVQKPSPSRNYNEGKAALHHLNPIYYIFLTIPIIRIFIVLE